MNEDMVKWRLLYRSKGRKAIQCFLPFIFCFGAVFERAVSPFFIGKNLTGNIIYCNLEIAR